MSSRQMRRLQQLVESATGIDGDSSDDDAMPETMQRPPQPRSKKNGKKGGKKPVMNADMLAQAEKEPLPAPVTTSDGSPVPRATTPPPTRSPKAVNTATMMVPLTTAAPDEGNVRGSDSSGEEGDDSPSFSDDFGDTSGAEVQQLAMKNQQQQQQQKPSATAEAIKKAEAAAGARRQEERRQRKRQLNKEKKARAAEDEELLEQVLQARIKEDPDLAYGLPSSSRNTNCAYMSGEGSSSPGPDEASASDLLSLLLVCDPTRLNARLERIRTFGAEAVEDVGDGLTSHRRADGVVRDNNSNSIFPEHGLHIRFRPSALATPNRYRWPPFDSLGMYIHVVDIKKEAQQQQQEESASAECVAKGAMATGGAASAKGLTHLSGGSAWPMTYALNCEAGSFRRAEEARQLCVTHFGGVRELLDALGSHGAYHVPTLLTISQSFQLTGDALRSQEVVDVALYTIGTLLAHFPVAGTWRRRVLPCALESSVWVHKTLHRGMHTALRRGCTRTALEMGKLLLSLDARDPMGVLLVLDYLALRAKRWVWLLEVYDHMVKDMVSGASPVDGSIAGSPAVAQGGRGAQETNAAADTGEEDTFSSSAVARRLVQLPGFFFSAALAKRFLEKEFENAEAASQSPGAEGGAAKASLKNNRPSKVLRDITPAQRRLIDRCPRATEMFAAAVCRFPLAGVRLVEALQGAQAVCSKSEHKAVDPFWGDVELAAAAEDVNGGEGEDEVAVMKAHVSRLFVARHADMWRPTESFLFVRDAICAAQPAPCASSEYGIGGVLSTFAECHSIEGSQQQLPYAHADIDAALTSLSTDDVHTYFSHYVSLGDEDVMGNTIVIPEELLREEEGGAAFDGAPLDGDAMQLLLRFDGNQQDLPPEMEQNFRQQIRRLRAEREAAAGRGGDAQPRPDIPQEVLDQLRMDAERPLDELEEEALLRFRALYGVEGEGSEGNSAVFTPREELELFKMRFSEDDTVRARLGSANMVRLLFMSLLPWNDVQSIALREELSHRGMDDPVVARNRRRRQQENEEWEAEEADWFDAQSDSDLEFHDID